MEYKEIILLKCGEIVLKGLNRSRFEQRLLSNIRHRLGRIGGFSVSLVQSTVYVAPLEEGTLEPAYEAMKLVYGVAALSRAAVCEKDMGRIIALAPVCCAGELARAGSFRVVAKRSDKAFPLTSPEVARETGHAILERFPHLKVDLHSPDVTVYVEVRDHAAYIHAGKDAGAGGIPVGTGGRAALLLSGGIDSPVAGHMMAKRGVELTAVHFESPPYTSARAKQKVVDLANAMAPRCGRFKLICVPVTELQELIRDRCPSELFTVVFRRFMMRISCLLAEKEGCTALITGESLGQVASQTIEAIAATNAVCDRPVLRPLIGMDKEEIVVTARKTGTYDISIEPYEDCCTVFTPKHPKTKPKIEALERAEAALDVAALCREAAEAAEEIFIEM